MFRNPRENASLSPHAKLKPSVGRPPSPPASSPKTPASPLPQPSQAVGSLKAMATKTMVTKTTTATPRSTTTQTNLRFNSAKKSPGGAAKPKPRPNGSILSFFKKSDASQKEDGSGLFLEDKTEPYQVVEDTDNKEGTPDWLDEPNGHRSPQYHEEGSSVKRRKLGHIDEERRTGVAADEAGGSACTPPPPDGLLPEADTAASAKVANASKVSRKIGPFVDDSDDDELPVEPEVSFPVTDNVTAGVELKNCRNEGQDSILEPQPQARAPHPPLIRQQTSIPESGDFEEFEGIEDFEAEEFGEGEEFEERRWMEEQANLEDVEGVFEGDVDEAYDGTADLRNIEPDTLEDGLTVTTDMTAPACPICNAILSGITDQEASVHVNNCLDGNPTPLPARTAAISHNAKKADRDPSPAKRFQRPSRAAKPGQENPFTLGSATAGPSSAFSRLMASHAEDAAWATASAAESAARGKPAYQRTCPFYKILPGFFICVDAFRYGAVKGCQAYFLSHFHSDHYIGLTSSWNHGPIYCSKVTANLVKQQLRVDPKFVVPLQFEESVEVPNTDGVQVTMIPANHCPGSSLFLFEKVVGQGKNPRKQRVLHCGDFRACRAHVEHPLLRPDLLDAVGAKQGQQKIDVCYLDTTYLNPKYAFPSQHDVIKACADMCVSLSKCTVDESDGWEQMKKDRAGSGMAKFVRKESDTTKQEEEEGITTAKPTTASPAKARGRLLVIVGTYSIGKERICLGIAKALNSKIYAPPAKQRICACLEDAELNARLTTDPRAAQVHMTPLFEIRADTLDDYLKDYRDTFSRAVGFRPSGWNYRPPNSRFVESPSVQTVLRSQNWRSAYSMRELVPQRGSTSRASCFGVPYSEHSSFRELTVFCCALRIDKIIPTVNVGSAKSRERMKGWCEKWAMEKKKNGLYRIGDGSDGSW